MRVKSLVSRRKFLHVSAGVFLAPSLFPLTSGAKGLTSSANRVHFGFVGTGGMGLANIDRVLGLGDKARIIGLCDVDITHRRRAKAKIDKAQGDSECLAFNDFRELCTRPDIDAIVISTPDHWHTLPALVAMRAGKDVYVEKPLSLTVDEGRRLVETAAHYGRIGQTGTQQRSESTFRQAYSIVRAGHLGDIKSLDIIIPGNNRVAAPTWREQPVPAGFDYDLWLGPAPLVPYTTERCHYNFRFIRDYALGQITNWGVHYIDIAQWILGPDVSVDSVSGSGEYPTSGLFNTATHVDFTAELSNRAVLFCRTRRDGAFEGRLRIEGNEGWLEVTRSSIKCSQPEWVKTTPLAALLETHPGDHMLDFLNAIHLRKAPIAPLSEGHRSTTTCILGHIAMQLRRPLKWSAATESFTNDTTADRLLYRTARGEWAALYNG